MTLPNRTRCGKLNKVQTKFDLYFQATGIESAKAKPKQKVCTLTFLHLIGEDVLVVYNNLTFDNDDDKFKLDKISEKFEAYCSQH